MGRRRRQIPWQQWYTEDERRYYRAITKFIDRRFFGLTAKGGNPYHTNGKNDPNQVYNEFNHRWKREKRRYGHEDARVHFLSEPTGEDERGHGRSWSFFVNSSRNEVHLHAVDIDFDTDIYDPNIIKSDALELAALIAKEVFGGVEVFIEPSRKRHGAYIWFKMRRSLAPEAYNRLLSAVSTFLKANCNGRFRARVDAIKGTVQYFTANPKFDFWKWAEEGDAYEKLKLTYRTREEFTYRADLETYLHHRGTPVTMPCAGAHLYEEDRLQRFLRWVEDERAVLGDSAFIQLVGFHPEEVKPKRERDKRSRRDSVQSVLVNEENRAWQMLKDADAWTSSVGACLYALQVTGGLATADDACALYEQHGAATGPRTAERSNRMDRILDVLRPDYDGSSKANDPHWFTADDVHRQEEIVRSKLSKHELEAVCEREGIALSYGQLALFKAVVTKNIRSNRGEVSYKSIREMFSHFGLAINNQKIRVMFELSFKLGFFRCVDERYAHYVDRNGFCRKYGLVEQNHPVSEEAKAAVAVILKEEREERSDKVLVQGLDDAPAVLDPVNARWTDLLAENTTRLDQILAAMRNTST